jgi:hypothetical protein
MDLRLEQIFRFGRLLELEQRGKIRKGQTRVRLSKVDDLSRESSSEKLIEETVVLVLYESD